MPKKLKKILIDRVDFVDKGSNPESHIMLVKRDKDALPSTKLGFFSGLSKKISQFSDTLHTYQARSRWWNIQSALDDTTREILFSQEENKSDLLSKVLTDFTSEAESALEDLANLNRDDFYYRCAGELSQFEKILENASKEEDFKKALDVFHKKENTELKSNGGEDGMPTLQELIDSLPEEQKKQVNEEITKRDSDISKLQDEVENLKKSTEPKKEDVTKGMSDEVKAKFEDLQKRADEAEKIAKTEREARRMSEFSKKAESYQNVEKVETIAKVLKDSFDVSEDFGKSVESLIKTANERLSTGEIFKSKGSDSTDPVDSFSKVESLAIKKMEIDTTLTKEKAIAKVLDENPNLYNESIEN